jgi:hypothetical protein
MHGARCGAGATNAAATTNEAAAGGCEGKITKQAAAEADAGVLDGPNPRLSQPLPPQPMRGATPRWRAW